MKKKKLVKRKQTRPVKKQLSLLTKSFFIISLFIVGTIFFFFYKNSHPSATIDYNKREMKSIPPEVKTATISASVRVPILMYHYVEYVQDKGDTIRQSLDIIPYIFTKQIETLKSNGYTFMFMSDVADVLDGKKTLPAKPIVLTFDDGYRDFYTDVFPILQKYNVKATAYIVPGFINRPNFMFSNQLDEVAKSELVEIGAHTVDHAYLKGIPPQRASYEIMGGKTLLEQMIHKPVVSFAYPYGAFDKQALELTEAAGFKTAVSTIPGIDQSAENRFFMPRIRPGARTETTLIQYLNQDKF